MGRIIQKNNGMTTIFTTGENISTIISSGNTYFLGVDSNTGVYEKLNPDGSIIDLEGSTGGGGLSSNLYEVTYSELTTHISNSTLSGGSYYMITDFATIYDQPDFFINDNSKGVGSVITYTGMTEPIIVLATSENTLSIDAYQPTYPKDKIKYDWSWSNTEINGTPTYGRISERIDEYENRTDYDHRWVGFVRYRGYETGITLTGTINEYNCTTGVMLGNGTLFSGELTTGSTIVLDSKNNFGYQVGVKVVNIIDDTTMDVVIDSGYTSTIFTVGDGYNFNLYTLNATGSYYDYKEVYIGQRIESDYSEFSTFILDGASLSNYIGDYSIFYINGVYSNSGFLLANNVFGSNSYSNTIGDRSYNNTTWSWFVRNDIAGRFYNNKITSGFYSNDIGEYFYDNKINGQFWRNTIGEYFYSNTTYNNFQNNLLGNGFNTNIINGQFYKNEIGNGFNNNNLGDQFYGNDIGNGFGYNKIATYFNNNTIGNEFNGNNLADQFYGNDIGNGFGYNTIATYFNNNTIGNGFNGNNLGDQFYGNDIGNGFNGNTTPGWFYKNKIANNFNRNPIIGDYFNNNVIGDNFQSNNIGQDFYYNTIDPSFDSNTTTSNFNSNKIKTEINSVDFTDFYGNITGFTYSNTGSTATDGLYLGVGQNSTTGIGVNATFDIEVSLGSVIGVTGNTQGKFYTVSDTLTILGTQISGVDVDDDVIITVTGINSLPSVYETYTCDIFERQGGTKRLSYYDSSDILTITNINE